MRRFRSLLSTKLVLAALVVAVGVGIYIASAPKAEAVIIAGPSVCAYYSSGSYTTVVGARGTGCCGEVISWGVTTKWKRCERLYCLDVLCPF